MKFSTQCFILIQLCSHSMAVHMVRVLFNDGEAPSNGGCNSTSDALLLDMLFNQTYRRNLRSNSDVDYDFIRELPVHSDRQLYPIYCKKYCAGFAKGTCRATNCRGYRRELDEPLANMENPYNVTCPDHINWINTTLDSFILSKLVSSSCRNLLKERRMYECYDDIVFGEIEYIKVMDKKDVTLNKPDEVLTICNNVSFTDYVRVQVAVNECVEKLETITTGPWKNFTFPPATKFPFYFEWRLYPFWSQPGRYTIQYVPDGIESKSKTLLYDIKSCRASNKQTPVTNQTTDTDQTTDTEKTTDTDQIMISSQNKAAIATMSPTTIPTKTPTKSPIKTPTKIPTKSPIKTPTKTPTKSPIKTPTKILTKSPIKTPTKISTNSPNKTPDGCKNDFICPANSSRIENRVCYDSFDDCKCNYGYYKSTYENKCLRKKY